MILGSAAVIEIVQMLTGGDVQSVSPFSRQLSRLASLMSGTDTSAHARIIMWRFGIIEGISSPLGHGVGSTARMFQMLSYMHNMFVEALFELGYVGFAAMLPLGYWTVTALLRLRNARRHVFELLCLAAAFAYQLKSGDIGNMGTWMFWLLVARGCVQHAATTSPPALAQPRRQRPLLKPLEVRIPAVANSPVQLAGIGPGAALPQGSGPRSRLDPSGSLE